MNKNRLTRKDRLNNRNVLDKMPRPNYLIIEAIYQNPENQFPD